MSAQKGSILLPLISAVAIITIVAVGYFFYKNQQLVSQTAQITYLPTPTMTPSPSNVQNETANWKTYTNTKYGFSFKYPANWSARDIFPDGILCNDHNTPGSTGIKGTICHFLDVRSQTNQGLTIFYGTKQENATFEQTPSGTHKILLESKAITLGTKEIKRDIFGWDQTVKTLTHTPKDAFFATYNSNNPIWFDNLGFQIDFSNFEEAGIIDRSNVYITDQILSTFKFVEQQTNPTPSAIIRKIPLTSTAGWKSIEFEGIKFLATLQTRTTPGEYPNVLYFYTSPEQVIASSLRVEDYKGGSRREQFYKGRTPEDCHQIYEDAMFGNIKALQIAIDGGWCQGGYGGGIVAVVGKKLVIFNFLNYDYETKIIDRWIIRDTIISTLVSE